MKTRNLIIAACAVSALAVSCEKTNGDDPAGPDGKPKILATIDMSPKASNGYLVPIYDLDADGASMDEAYEVRTSNYVITYNDWAFVVEGTSGGNIRKFTVNQDGTLSEAGQLTVDGTGFGAAHLLVISETKAYAGIRFRDDGKQDCDIQSIHHDKDRGNRSDERRKHGIRRH